MQSLLIENLTSFNLTRQEATIYVALLTHGQMTGYEVAKETGVARSNVYSALQSLVEKGALYLIEGETTKYLPVEIDRIHLLLVLICPMYLWQFLMYQS